MSRILYYLLLKPVSRLPLSWIYRISDVGYGLSRLGIAYRRKVVLSNLKMVFPEKEPKEIRAIADRFYQHFFDLIAESIRLFSISQQEAVNRFRVTNPEIFKELARLQKSVILVGGHYQNWELFAVATPPQIPHRLLGIYSPLSDAYMEKKFSASRSKFGLVLVPKKEVKAFFESFRQELTVTTFAIDQSPRKSQKVYWTRFLNLDTAVHYGAEKYAKEYDYTVVYGSAVKIKRGYYELTFEVLEANPRQTPEGEITARHTRKLEEQITTAPEYWLWTHKRWKLKK